MKPSLLIPLMLLSYQQHALGHMNLVATTPRNAMDGSLDEFKGGKSLSMRMRQLGITTSWRGGTSPPLVWSQGCSIGCDTSHGSSTWRNNGSIPTRQITRGWPHADKAGFRTTYCDTPGGPGRGWDAEPHARRGGERLVSLQPWRAPGTAPVVDPCGQAGGKYDATPMGRRPVFFTTNVSGRVLKMATWLEPPTSGAIPTWVAGTGVQVAWGAGFAGPEAISTVRRRGPPPRVPRPMV